MLYEQQKKAGFNLAILESKVSAVRKEFTQVILHKNNWETEDTINLLFEKSERLEMNNQLNALNKRSFESSLSNNFSDALNFITKNKD